MGWKSQFFFVQYNKQVKIRPLWDGNNSFFASLYSLSVKIRPLWDGNIYALGAGLLACKLKSDHCGMEIISLRFLHSITALLKSDHCGMELKIYLKYQLKK